MNLRAAKNELGGPPRIGMGYLLLEAIGLFAFTVLIVGLVD